METQGSVRQIKTVFLILGLISITPPFAQAHTILDGWQNQTGSGPGFSIGPNVTLYDTHQNYDSNSKLVSLVNGASVQRTYLDLNFTYGFNENSFVFGRISALSTKISSSLFVNNQNSFGLSDQMVGYAYRLFHNDSGLSINLQGEVTIPAYSDNDSAKNHTPYLGDGTTDFTFGSFVEVPILTGDNSQFFLVGGAGYVWRSYGFSSAIPWNLLLKLYPIEQGITVAAGLRGNISLGTDISAPTISVSDTNKGGGGSFLIYGINPNWALAQASLGYQTKNINFTLNGAIPISGKNAPEGTQISFGVQFNFAKSTAKDGNTDPAQTSIGQYNLEAKVLSTNDQLYLVKINRGSSSGIEKGQIFDIFQKNQRIAQAKVANVRDDESALRVLEYFQEQSIEVDAVAKRVVP